MIPATSSVVLGSGGVRPTLDLNFAATRTLDPRIDFTRATSATYFGETGTLQTASSGAARFDFDPTTKACRGLLIEEARTNSIRNSTMVGAVAGTPGTFPTNWAYAVGGTGLTWSVVGTGTDAGIAYIDIRVSGTVTATNFGDVALFETVSGIATANAVTWTQSVYIKLVAGTTSGLNNGGFRTGAYHYDSGLTYLGNLTGSYYTPTSSWVRTANSYTLNNASVAYIRPYLTMSVTKDAVIDITVRIGLPQMEQGSFATSVIPTSTVAVTRNADVAVMSGTNFSSWYNASEGTVAVTSATFDSLSSDFPRAFAVSDGTTANRYILTRNNGSGQARYSMVTGGVTQYASDIGAQTLSAMTNVAVAYNASTVASSVAGAAAVTGSISALPSVNTLSIGTSEVANSDFINGWIKRLTYYPKRLGDSTLQQLTK